MCQRLPSAWYALMHINASVATKNEAICCKWMATLCVFFNMFLYFLRPQHVGRISWLVVQLNKKYTVCRLIDTERYTFFVRTENDKTLYYIYVCNDNVYPTTKQLDVFMNKINKQIGRCLIHKIYLLKQKTVEEVRNFIGTKHCVAIFVDIWYFRICRFVLQNWWI